MGRENRGGDGEAMLDMMLDGRRPLVFKSQHPFLAIIKNKKRIHLLTKGA